MPLRSPSLYEAFYKTNRWNQYALLSGERRWKTFGGCWNPAAERTTRTEMPWDLPGKSVGKQLAAALAIPPALCAQWLYSGARSKAAVVPD